MPRSTFLLRSRTGLRCALIVSVFFGLANATLSRSAADDEALSGEHSARELSKAFRRAAERVVPSVVTVVAKVRAEGRGMLLRDGIRVLPSLPAEMEDGSIGSGVNIHSSGLVLTNSHVIRGADSIVVRTSDGTEYSVSDVRQDDLSDLAVLTLQGSPTLPVARLGDSSQLEIGDWVLAVGSPFELEATVSAGIISGKERGISKIKRGKLLQTDAAINPGNSGGPLVNLEGEVVGINVAIASNSGGYQGIGFAIPSSQVRWIVEQLVRHGAVRRSYLGIKVRDLDPNDARQVGLPTAKGVVVREITGGGPAESAGLRQDDVIVQFAGIHVGDSRDLQGLVEQRPVGSRHKLTFIRGGTTREVEIVIAELPSQGM